MDINIDELLDSCNESFGGRCSSELLSPAAETSSNDYVLSVTNFLEHRGKLRQFAETRKYKQAASDREDRLICLKQHLPALEVLGKTIKENKRLLEDYSTLKYQYEGLNVVITQYKSLVEVKDKEIIDWKSKCKEHEELHSTLTKESKALQRSAQKYLRAFIVVAEMLQKCGMLPKVYERHLGKWRNEQEDRTRDKGIRRQSNVHEQCRTVNLNIQDVSSPCATGSVCSIDTGFESSVSLSDDDHCVAPEMTLSCEKDILLRNRSKLKKHGKDNLQSAKAHGNNVIVETSVDSDSSCESLRNNFSINNSKKPVAEKIKLQISGNSFFKEFKNTIGCLSDTWTKHSIETEKLILSKPVETTDVVDLTNESEDEDLPTVNGESTAITEQITEDAENEEFDELAPYQESSMPVVEDEPTSDEINLTKVNVSKENNLNVTDRNSDENPDFGCLHKQDSEKIVDEESTALTEQITEDAEKEEFDELAPYQESSMPVVDDEPSSDEINVTNINASKENNLNVTDRNSDENPDFGCFLSEETGFINQLNDVSDIHFNKSPTLSQNQMESTAENLVFDYSDTENVSVNLDNQEENSLEISRILNEMCFLRKVLSPVPSEPGGIYENMIGSDVCTEDRPNLLVGNQFINSENEKGTVEIGCQTDESVCSESYQDTTFLKKKFEEFLLHCLPKLQEVFKQYFMEFPSFFSKDYSTLNYGPEKFSIQDNVKEAIVSYFKKCNTEGVQNVSGDIFIANSTCKTCSSKSMSCEKKYNSFNNLSKDESLRRPLAVSCKSISPIKMKPVSVVNCFSYKEKKLKKYSRIKRLKESCGKSYANIKSLTKIKKAERNKSYISHPERIYSSSGHFIVSEQSESKLLALTKSKVNKRREEKELKRTSIIEKRMKRIKSMEKICKNIWRKLTTIDSVKSHFTTPDQVNGHSLDYNCSGALSLSENCQISESSSCLDSNHFKASRDRKPETAVNKDSEIKLKEQSFQEHLMEKSFSKNNSQQRNISEKTENMHQQNKIVNYSLENCENLLKNVNNPIINVLDPEKDNISEIGHSLCDFNNVVNKCSFISNDKATSSGMCGERFNSDCPGNLVQTNNSEVYGDLYLSSDSDSEHDDCRSTVDKIHFVENKVLKDIVTSDKISSPTINDEVHCNVNVIPERLHTDDEETDVNVGSSSHVFNVPVQSNETMSHSFITNSTSCTPHQYQLMNALVHSEEKECSTLVSVEPPEIVDLKNSENIVNIHKKSSLGEMTECYASPYEKHSVVNSVKFVCTQSFGNNNVLANIDNLSQPAELFGKFSIEKRYTNTKDIEAEVLQSQLEINQIKDNIKDCSSITHSIYNQAYNVKNTCKLLDTSSETQIPEELKKSRENVNSLGIFDATNNITTSSQISLKNSSGVQDSCKIICKSYQSIDSMKIVQQIDEESDRILDDDRFMLQSINSELSLCVPGSIQTQRPGSDTLDNPYKLDVNNCFDSSPNHREKSSKSGILEVSAQDEFVSRSSLGNAEIAKLSLQSALPVEDKFASGIISNDQNVNCIACEVDSSDTEQKSYKLNDECTRSGGSTSLSEVSLENKVDDVSNDTIDLLHKNANESSISDCISQAIPNVDSVTQNENVTCSSVQERKSTKSLRNEISRYFPHHTYQLRSKQIKSNVTPSVCFDVKSSKERKRKFLGDQNAEIDASHCESKYAQPGKLPRTQTSYSDNDCENADQISCNKLLKCSVEENLEKLSGFENESTKFQLPSSCSSKVQDDLKKVLPISTASLETTSDQHADNIVNCSEFLGERPLKILSPSHKTTTHDTVRSLSKLTMLHSKAPYAKKPKEALLNKSHPVDIELNMETECSISVPVSLNSSHVHSKADDVKLPRTQTSYSDNDCVNADKISCNKLLKCSVGKYLEKLSGFKNESTKFQLSSSCSSKRQDDLKEVSPISIESLETNSDQPTDNIVNYDELLGERQPKILSPSLKTISHDTVRSLSKLTELYGKAPFVSKSKEALLNNSHHVETECSISVPVSLNSSPVHSKTDEVKIGNLNENFILQRKKMDTVICSFSDSLSDIKTEDSGNLKITNLSNQTEELSEGQVCKESLSNSLSIKKRASKLERFRKQISRARNKMKLRSAEVSNKKVRKIKMCKNTDVKLQKVTNSMVKKSNNIKSNHLSSDELMPTQTKAGHDDEVCLPAAETHNTKSFEECGKNKFVDVSKFNESIVKYEMSPNNFNVERHSMSPPFNLSSPFKQGAFVKNRRELPQLSHIPGSLLLLKKCAIGCLDPPKDSLDVKVNTYSDALRTSCKQSKTCLDTINDSNYMRERFRQTPERRRGLQRRNKIIGKKLHTQYLQRKNVDLSIVETSKLCSQTENVAQLCNYPPVNSQKVKDLANISCNDTTIIQHCLKMIKVEERTKKYFRRSIYEIPVTTRKTIQSVLKTFLEVEYKPELVEETSEALYSASLKCSPVFVGRQIVRCIMNDSHNMDNSCTPPAPPMSYQQRRLLCLVRSMESHFDKFSSFADIILTLIEKTNLNLVDCPNVSALEKTSRFYTILCRIKHYVSRLQKYCYDVMYCYKYRIYPVLFTVMTCFPSLFPNAAFVNDSPIYKTMVFILLSAKMNSNSSVYKCQSLKNALMNIYGFKRGEFVIHVLVKHLILKLTGLTSPCSNLHCSIIILAKHQEWQWTLKHLIMKEFIPIIQGFVNGTVPKVVLIEVLQLISEICRPFPCDHALEDIKSIIKVFVALLYDKRADAEIQTVIVQCLTYFVKFFPSPVATALEKWSPKFEVSEKTLRYIINMMKTKYWTEYLTMQRGLPETAP